MSNELCSETASNSPDGEIFRNLCDIKQEGKLNPEQFALAMWLIAKKQSGKDPPAALTPDMVPPSMRPKVQNEASKAIYRECVRRS